MEKEKKDLTIRINLKDLNTCKTAFNPLELHLFIKREYEVNEEVRKRLHSLLSYSFEQ